MELDDRAIDKIVNLIRENPGIEYDQIDDKIQILTISHIDEIMFDEICKRRALPLVKRNGGYYFVPNGADDEE